MRVRRALFWALWLRQDARSSLALLMTGSRFLVGLAVHCYRPQYADHQSAVTVLNNSWGYFGMLVVPCNHR